MPLTLTLTLAPNPHPTPTPNPHPNSAPTPSPIPEQACPFCRRVREVVTYLDLEITVVPCARGSRHREHAATAAKELLRKERPSFPYLEDVAAGVGSAYYGHAYYGSTY